MRAQGVIHITPEASDQEDAMSYQFAKVEREARVTVVTINRPEVMNAIHPPAQQELDRIFDDFQNDA
jgi:crotonobetainyl-CoA hydratase